MSIIVQKSLKFLYHQICCPRSTESLNFFFLAPKKKKSIMTLSKTGYHKSIMTSKFYVFNRPKKNEKRVSLSFSKSCIKTQFQFRLKNQSFPQISNFLLCSFFNNFKKKQMKVSNSIKQTGTQNRLFNTKQDESFTFTFCSKKQNRGQ